MDLELLACLDDEDLDDYVEWLIQETGEEKPARLNIETLSDDKCKSMFRFENKDDLVRLAGALRIPEQFRGPNRTLESGLNGLCMMLRRLAYPNRLLDLTELFGRSETELSIIINTVVDHVYDQFNFLLSDLNQPWMSNEHLARYAMAIHNAGAPLINCFGFVDGTIRPFCRPTLFQREVYSGHKRVHGLKFQSLMLPNGIIANLFGPVEARRHDSYMLHESGLMPQLEGLETPTGMPYCIYGDPAYPLRPNLLCPFSGAILNDDQKKFNKDMSSVRQCVEWGFGSIINQFAFLDYKKNLKLFLQPVAKLYMVATIITNCRVCMYGSQTGSYFNIDPPTLEEYLHFH